MCCITCLLYICTVFFIVLDLRLTKIGCRETTIFFVYMPLIILLKYRFYFSFEDYIVLRLFEFLLIGI